MKNIEQAFLAAYDQYAEKILKHVFFRVNDRKTAEDLTQETFFKTWDYFSRGDRKIENLKAFLYRVATNLIIDHYRQSSKKTTSLEDVDSKEIAYEPKVEREIDNSISKNLIQQSLSSLDPDYREILIYRYVDDLSIKEISALTGKTPTNVRVIIHRAIRKIKEKI